MTTHSNTASRRKPRQAGQAIVESALVMLVFLVMLFGLLDFARMVWTFTMLSHGAREATRYAMVHGTASGNAATVSQIQGIVTSRSPGLDPNNTTTTVTFSPDQTAGSTVKVVVKYSFYPLSPYVPVGPVSMKSTSQMVIYQ